MRPAIHIVIILALGVGLGFTVRAIRAAFTPERVARQTPGPRPDEVVFSDERADEADQVDAAEIENAEPSKPPEDEEWLSRFELTERSGETVTSDDLLGAPYVVSFFFTTCPSTCVQQNQKLKELQDEFAGDGIRFVAISCDPETDTPEKLREYAARFGADEDQWLFMTGEMTYIRRVGAEVYRLPVNRKFHTDRFVLVDADGNVDTLYNWPEPRQFAKLQDRIRELLSEAKQAG